MIFSPSILFLSLLRLPSLVAHFISFDLSLSLFPCMAVPPLSLSWGWPEVVIGMKVKLVKGVAVQNLGAGCVVEGGKFEEGLVLLVVMEGEREREREWEEEGMSCENIE